jgi:putative transposase
MPVRTGGEKALWQRRYWEHTIRDEADLQAHIDYIHFNPVKHGHVERVRDWPHSTFHRYLASGHLNIDWGDTPPEEPASTAKFGE